ncbi:MAG: dihydropteroate synthase [Thermacetogeniaceae bacterium]|jgi:cobalamin-dependent methionine synthase I
MLIIGESLNGSIPAVGKAIINHDEQWIRELAKKQVDCGAQMLDVNAGGISGRDECADLVWLVEVVQDSVSVPLVLDSTNPEALRAAISVYRGPKPILSSLTAEEERFNALLPLVLDHDCGLIALCIDESGIPLEPKRRLEIAETLVERVTAAGIKPEDLYLDPLVLTLGVNYHAGAITLNTLHLIREHFPQVNTVCGVSNVSFEMPKRRLLNRYFAAMLMAFGLEAFMVDVCDREMMVALTAAAALTGRDEWCRNFFKSSRAGKLD